MGESRIVFAPTSAYATLSAGLPAEPALRRLTEASNNAIVFGERLFL